MRGTRRPEPSQIRLTSQGADLPALSMIEIRPREGGQAGLRGSGLPSRLQPCQARPQVGRTREPGPRGKGCSLEENVCRAREALQRCDDVGTERGGAPVGSRTRRFDVPLPPGPTPAPARGPDPSAAAIGTETRQADAFHRVTAQASGRTRDLGRSDARRVPRADRARSEALLVDLGPGLWAWLKRRAAMGRRLDREGRGHAALVGVVGHAALSVKREQQQDALEGLDVDEEARGLSAKGVGGRRVVGGSGCSLSGERGGGPDLSAAPAQAERLLTDVQDE